MKIITRVRQLVLTSCFAILSCTVSAHESAFDYDDFAKNYFASWVKTQSPNASKADLEQYLSLLTDDVAYQHPPYKMDDSRKPGGKEELRKGMSYWLGANTAYEAKLVNTITSGDVLVFKYDAYMTAKDPKSGKVSEIERHYIDVVQLDKGKVAVIRRFGK